MADRISLTPISPLRSTSPAAQIARGRFCSAFPTSISTSSTVTTPSPAATPRRSGSGCRRSRCWRERHRLESRVRLRAPSRPALLSALPLATSTRRLSGVTATAVGSDGRAALTCAVCRRHDRREGAAGGTGMKQVESYDTSPATPLATPSPRAWAPGVHPLHPASGQSSPASHVPARREQRTAARSRLRRGWDLIVLEGIKRGRGDPSRPLSEGAVAQRSVAQADDLGNRWTDARSLHLRSRNDCGMLSGSRTRAPLLWLHVESRRE